MWLSHHWPDDYDRCVRVGHRHICRRCLFFYPVCFAFTALSLAGLGWPTSWDPWLLWLLPVPVVTEWWLEHLDVVHYSAVRQVTLSLIAAPAVGVGLARYLEHPTDGLFWSVVLVYAVICLVPVVIGMKRARAASVES